MATQERTDWNLCNQTWQRIVRARRRRAKATDFSGPERPVVLVWTVLGIVGNAGFEGLFSEDLPGDPGYELALEAFERIGCKEATQAFGQALALFPSGRPPQDKQMRKKLFAAHAEADRDRVAARFFSSEAEIVHCLANYIRKTGVRSDK